MRLRRSVVALSALVTLAGFTALPTPAYADTTTATYIVQLEPGVSADTMVTKLMGSHAKVVHKVFQGGIATLNAAQARALQGSPYVKAVHKDAVVTTTATETSAPWDLDMLDSPTAVLDGSYTYPNDGSGVTTYVLDSGIQRNHAEFASANVAPGYDFVTGDTSTDPVDCDGHGTAVSSLIAGATLGAAKGVTLVPLKVLDCTGTGSESDIIQAADWIAANRPPGAPAVANLSFGVSISQLSPGDTSLQDAIQGLITSGVTVVAAAGNGDSSGNGVDACTESPAFIPAAITVAAVDKTFTETKWTNYGSCVDLYAPGQNVYVAGMSTTSTTTISTGSGTSFSAPLATAAAALVLHDHPTWTPQQVSAALVSRAASGLVTQQSRTAQQSPNKLLQVTGTYSGPAPTITGSTSVGLTLTAAPHWTPMPTTLTYQWYRNGVAIPTATAGTYVTTPVDLGQSLTVTVAGSGDGFYNVSGTSPAVVPVEPPHPGMVVSLTPSRLLDTRSGLGGTSGPLYNGQVVTLPVAGVAGVASTASAVLVNITVTDATSPGFVTAYASGSSRPATSNGNFAAGVVSANLAMVPVGADGAIALYVMLVPGASVQLVVDVQSFVAGGTATEPGAVVPVTPTRLWDTRQHSALGSGGVLTLPVTGAAGVPDGARAVFANVTVTGPTASGYLTVYPAGEVVPATSNVNFVAGLTVPNLVLVKVGANGSISIQNANLGGSVQVVVDIQGYVVAGATPTAAGAVVPVSPIRIVDTRIGLGAQGPVAARTGVVVTVAGGAIPATASGVFMNFTVTDPQTAGWVAAYPTQASLPLVSNVNFVGGQVVPNLATVGLTNGQASLFNGSWGSTHMVVDVFAYIL